MECTSLQNLFAYHQIKAKQANGTSTHDDLLFWPTDDHFVFFTLTGKNLRVSTVVKLMSPSFTNDEGPSRCHPFSPAND
ncbi:hypothetical protein YC2023_103293 [Brassica napus]